LHKPFLCINLGISVFEPFVEIVKRGKKNNKKIVGFYVLTYSENNSKIITKKGEESYGKQKEICLLHAAFNV
jgi:hypothetical protein